VDQIDAMRTSSWYQTFIEITPKASFINMDSIGEKAAFLEVCRSDMLSAGADCIVVARRGLYLHSPRRGTFIWTVEYDAKRKHYRAYR
jgi:hypothetical protein